MATQIFATWSYSSLRCYGAMLWDMYSKKTRNTFLRNCRTSLQALKGGLGLIYRSSVLYQSNSYNMVIFGITTSILEAIQDARRRSNRDTGGVLVGFLLLQEIYH